jgi:hypothetical protein
VPIDVQDSGFSVVDRISCAGVYASVLQRLCEEATYEPYAALLCETNEQMAQLRRGHEQRMAALMRERCGEPLTAHSRHLLAGLPSPFDTWPRGGGQRTFVVTPDDVITLQPKNLPPGTGL